MRSLIRRLTEEHRKIAIEIFNMASKPRSKRTRQEAKGLNAMVLEHLLLEEEKLYPMMDLLWKDRAKYIIEPFRSIRDITPGIERVLHEAASVEDDNTWETYRRLLRIFPARFRREEEELFYLWHAPLGRSPAMPVAIENLTKAG